MKNGRYKLYGSTVSNEKEILAELTLEQNHKNQHLIH